MLEYANSKKKCIPASRKSKARGRARGYRDVADKESLHAASRQFDSSTLLCPSHCPTTSSIFRNHTTSHLPSSIIISFKIEDTSSNDMPKVFELLRTLYGSSDEWVIFVQAEAENRGEPLAMFRLPGRSMLAFHCDELRKRDVERVVGAMVMTEREDRWRILWKPKDPVAAVSRIHSLGDAITWAARSKL
jgi:hypothetical protein